MADVILQQAKLERLFSLVRGMTDSFYGRRLAGYKLNWHNFTRLPFTTKDDLLHDRLMHAPFGSNFTGPSAEYTRFCQTSGTSSGQPMAVLDTPESWNRMLDCWRQVFRAAGLKRGEDRVFFAFSFGPFLGFWTAFEAAAGEYLAMPGGGLSSTARLETMARYQATVLCCTPTYALRLGESIGAPSGVGLDQLAVKKIIVAGEAGGSLPTTRQRLRELWGGAQIFDHHGMTEVGPVSYEDPHHEGSLCVIEDAYLAEVLDGEGREVADGHEGELVLTTLDRVASPLIRYRTGDWVCKQRIDGQLFLEGGILARCDDMVVIRGVNIYPSAIENVVRRMPEVAEFMVEQRRVDSMEEIEVLIEAHGGQDAAQLARRLEGRLKDTFALRIPVRVAEAMTLPRYEFKSQRWRRVG
ncbi:phenylacetate--CoA ligase [Phragmitibacter flavus]|uniref:Phenylacetate--CoA ligase n=1 Tax=Phragmitibacter flavus TaxID=2576071 RepID=A0A5R8KEQ9_9BACT|nr:AMP-binding protein [Phragmitibacter flavus]TLD70780.1 phenylacetate--CoA ligase [Phragmitibacter flavus]